MIMEEGLIDEIFYEPKHPYTKALLNSVPRVDEMEKERLKPIKGTAPALINPPKGCPFAETLRVCYGKVLHRSTQNIGSFTDTQKCMCFLYEEGGI